MCDLDAELYLQLKILPKMQKIGQNWCCLICCYEQPAKKQMFDHIESKHIELSERPNYVCYACNTSFTSRNSYRTHKSRFKHY